jgi:hypothetical protein
MDFKRKEQMDLEKNSIQIFLNDICDKEVTEAMVDISK